MYFHLWFLRLRTLLVFFFFSSVVCWTIIQFGTVTKVVLNRILTNLVSLGTNFIQPVHVEMCLI